MKKLCFFFWMLIFLLPAGVQAASNESVLFEGEGEIIPTLKSQEIIDPNFLGQNCDGIALNIDHGDFPNIIVNVTVSGSNGKPVEGLSASDLEVSEQSECETEPVMQFLTGFAENFITTPISIALVFDVSGSMWQQSRLADAKTAAINFLSNLQYGDRASLVTFSGCNQGGIIMPSADVENDRDQNGTPDIEEAIMALTLIDRTAVYDGIAKGVDSIAAEAFPKGVIIFTDGQTNDDCHFNATQVIQKAKDKGIPVYTIGLQNDSMNAQLNSIAVETGGYYQEAPNALDMEELYNNIAKSIRGQYALSYITHNPLQDGTQRTVTVYYDGKTCSQTYIAPGTLNPNPPAIDHSPIATWQENTTIPITAAVSDPDPGDSISRVALSYRNSQAAPAAYTSIDMDNSAGDDYSAMIPAEIVTLAGIEYFLTAWDARDGLSENGSASAPHFISVTAAAQPPVAEAGQDKSANEGDFVSLDGSGSLTSTSDGQLTYAWIQLSGISVELSAADMAMPSFTAPMTGPEGTTLAFELTVTDSTGQSGSDIISIFINDFLAPEADFNWSPASPAAEQSIAFIDASVPEGGKIVSWDWAFGGEGVSDSQNPSFVFPERGTYSVRLTVADEFGSVGTAVKSITVSEPVCPGGDCSGSGGCFIGSAGAAFMMK